MRLDDDVVVDPCRLRLRDVHCGLVFIDGGGEDIGDVAMCSIGCHWDEGGETQRWDARSGILALSKDGLQKRRGLHGRFRQRRRQRPK